MIVTLSLSCAHLCFWHYLPWTLNTEARTWLIIITTGLIATHSYFFCIPSCQIQVTILLEILSFKLLTVILVVRNSHLQYNIALFLWYWYAWFWQRPFCELPAIGLFDTFAFEPLFHYSWSLSKHLMSKPFLPYSWSQHE